MTDRSPERDYGGDAALVERVTCVVQKIADRHALTLTFNEILELEISCTFPKQQGLDFEIWFALSGDEVTFGSEGWYANIFPADADDKLDIIRETLEGLVTGEVRTLLYTALGRTKPYWSVVQCYKNGRWTNVSTGMGCAIPPIIRPAVLRNGHTTAQGYPRPAWGSIVVFAGIAVLVSYFFR